MTATYRNIMSGAATLADARNECAAHARRVEGMLDGMQKSLDNVGCSMMGR